MNRGLRIGDGKGDLDFSKIEEALNEAEKTNPDMFKAADGTRIMPADVVSALRGAWVDDLRQGVKIPDALAKLEFIKKPDGSLSAAYGKGILHIASAVFMGGILTARSVKGGITPANKAGIASASMIVSGLLLEGGSKWNKAIGDPGQRWANWMSNGTLDKMENAGRILGGLGNMLAGGFSIASGVNALNQGDKLGAGFGLTGGILGISAGIFSTAEGITAALGGAARAVSWLGLGAGVLGFATAAFAAIALSVLSIVEVFKHGAQQDDFYANLSPTLQQYGITGGPMEDSDWPITEGA